MTEKALDRKNEQRPAAARAPATENTYVPDVDIYEEGDKVHLVADLPGVDKESVELTVESWTPLKDITL
jgi:HSP20 family molecular chaperone IbpA